ncbi:16S rRNA (adenine(1518)-N(6)/adenine(1519)-N(6))-dimethyltransferase RsmA [Candidatus Symbiobacter mobilis]|uniref:Ribosomal RNA small subunit methyltransferase A n=1 Tax=Candidatus Symbiobacter mobilis CR TaxID=946483 RepID=U5N901_9BURK|nr:16S rRNA (adenine(1518)-N(6)/adenine(1519)-N(6))-dimethyltransferase RsmA [Candidatus Symbiobacter mobilis]AGX86743.1 rRNA dimethyltransferase [Candidatus Symbiobacter mobilis CR]
MTKVPGSLSGSCNPPHSCRGHIARKRFGQHFLVDGAVVDAIVDAIDPQPGEYLVEIGPGLGALSEPIAERALGLTVVEIDRDLAQRLRSSQPRWHVVEADVLQVDFTAMAQSAQGDGKNLRIVGNLPYNLSSPILFHLLRHIDAIQDQHCMLQREVVERMVAVPCTAEYSRLSVMLQAHYEIERLLDVAPESFYPPPRVHSAVVRMIPLPNRPPPAQQEALEALLRVAFAQRRKILRHGLGTWLTANGVQAPINLQRRAEEIGVEEYLALAQQVASSPGFATTKGSG